MTIETITVLQRSIEALGSEDFNVHSGWKTDIYLDPETRVVYTFVGSNSMPMDAFHDIDIRLLSVHSGSIPSAVQSAIESVSDEIDSILDYYQGTEWNGSNHVGQWAEGIEDAVECLQEKLSESAIGCYWEPGEWFEPVIDDLKTEWQSGKSTEQIIDGQHLGNDCDGEVDRQESIDWLNGMIEEWSDEDSGLGFHTLPEYDEDPNTL